MTIKTEIKENTYLDSITLMTISTRANKLEHVEQAMIGMGTSMNVEVIRNVGLYTPELDSVTPGDLMIVVDLEEDADEQAVMEEIEDLFLKKIEESSSERSYSTLDAAVQDDDDTSIVVISVNGEYAAREAMKALKKDLHVMLFSNNVSLEDEIMLKKYAHEQGLFMMGPDCGTAIINGVGLCFANKVRSGNIGIVGASGTGSQEVSVQIHKMGLGISQLIGTGGRDLSKEVGGIMMMDGMDALAEDEETKVIVLISKPPAKEVEEKILRRAEQISKPVVIYFIGGEEKEQTSGNVSYVHNSLEAAQQAVAISSGKSMGDIGQETLDAEKWKNIAKKFNPDQKYARGLFCGGTLCDEMIYAIKEVSNEVYSNISKDPDYLLSDMNQSQGHTFIDFGDDFFTQGRPHPMIDPTTRIERLLQEAKDPTVSVIALDFELGYGSHEDPVGVLLPALKEAKEIAEKENRFLEIVAYVLGTEEDPQNLEEQRAKLLSANVSLATSNSNLCEIVANLINEEE